MAITFCSCPAPKPPIKVCCATSLIVLRYQGVLRLLRKSARPPPYDFQDFGAKPTLQTDPLVWRV